MCAEQFDSHMLILLKAACRLLKVAFLYSHGIISDLSICNAMWYGHVSRPIGNTYSGTRYIYHDNYYNLSPVQSTQSEDATPPKLAQRLRGACVMNEDTAFSHPILLQ
jgi:hypothetical protein